MKNKKYQTPNALLSSLSKRLKEKAKSEGTDIQRLRRSVAFDRLLIRLFSKNPNLWVLKGGYAMELRISNPRATKDIDLALIDLTLTSKDSELQNKMILKELRSLASVDLGDFFIFQIEDPTLDLDGPPYGGARFPIIALVDGHAFAKFHLDVGVGDALIEPLDIIVGEDWLGFAGLHTKGTPTLSIEQHFAEKIHAYTLPREDRLNSRVKDLIDLILLIRMEKITSSKLKEAIKQTFDRRQSHEMPENLEAPPSQWLVPFANMAKECELNLNLEEAFNELHKFIKMNKVI